MSGCDVTPLLVNNSGEKIPRPQIANIPWRLKEFQVQFSLVLSNALKQERAE